MKRWFFERAWLGHVARNVVVDVDGDTITQVREDAECPPDSVRLDGFVVPGLANAHSHVFHRVLRGRTHGARGTFWSWRSLMYDVAGIVEPEVYHELARAVFTEMLLSGITAVGEFHYLHHKPDGSRYDDPNAMGRALIMAAQETGIRLTLFDTCYLRGGFGKELQGTQTRFSDDSVRNWIDRISELESTRRIHIGTAVHSVRAVGRQDLEAVAAWATAHDRPIHVHVSEQPSENADCVHYTGMSPTRLLAESGVLGENSTAIHATFLLPNDIEILRETGTTVCFCPTAERDLADGVGPSPQLAGAGVPLCVGSDSHAVIDLFLEGRLIELHQRLMTGQRGHHTVEELWQALTFNGMRSLGWNAGRIATGMQADFVAVSLDSPRLAGVDGDLVADHVLFAANSADVNDVIVAGERVVENGEHRLFRDVGEALALSIARVCATLPQ